MRAIVILGLLALALAGCSGGTTSDGDFVTPEQDGQGRYVIHMEPSLRFSPANAVVPVGATVVFVNDGGSHDVRSDSLGFRSPFPVEEEYEVTVDEPGDHPFWCNPHENAGMKGVLRVTAA